MVFPQKVVVEMLIKSRYPDNQRPADWDMRFAGLDRIQDSTGREILLQSDGGQSPPQPGWVIMLQDGDLESGFSWTLYGFVKDQVLVGGSR